jgi:hypothetical protein
MSLAESYAQLAISIDYDSQAWRRNARTANPRDKCNRLHISDMDSIVIEEVTSLADFELLSRC